MWEDSPMVVDHGIPCAVSASWIGVGVLVNVNWVLWVNDLDVL